jgi:hypothetical protein
MKNSPAVLALGLLALAALPGAGPASGAPLPLLSLDAPLVFDPKLDDGAGGTASEPLTVRSWGASGTVLGTLAIRDAQGNTVRTLGATAHAVGATWVTFWDGRDDSGRTIDPGAYTGHLDVTGSLTGSLDASIDVVRLGARAIAFQDGGTARVPLTYHATQGKPRHYFAIDSGGPHWTLPLSTVSVGCLDDAHGAPLPAPAPWADTGSPPLDAQHVVLARGRAFPVAYVLRSSMSVQVTLGDRTCSVATGAALDCGFPIPGVELRVNAGAAPSAPVAPGDQVTLALGPGAPSTVSRAVVSLPLRFEYQDASGWHPVPGQQTTSHEVYGVLGLSRASDKGSLTPSSDPRQSSFVAALADVTSWCSTTATVTSMAALETIARAVYAQSGLRYDTSAGAPAYADGSQVTPSLAFSEFLTGRKRGDKVNCSDCAALVGMYARDVGIEMQSALLLPAFNVNYTKLIGGTAYKKGPAFMFHTVATVSSGVTVHDACLEIDDGPHPGSVEPRVEVQPIDMGFLHYESKLTPGFIQVWSLGLPSQH